MQGNLMLLITAIIWGTAFVAQSEGMRYVEPFTYNAIRTLLGGIVLIPVIAFLKRILSKGSDTEKPATSRKDTVLGGIVCGIVLFAASSFQQCGIPMTTAGKAGFITALYIIMVPLIQVFLYRRTGFRIWCCVLIAAVGFYLLCIHEGFRIEKGDWLVLCGAVFFSVHIMVIAFFNSKNADGMVMSCIQFMTAGILMLICMLLFEHPTLQGIWDAKITILYAGVLSCGVAYTLQILGQRDTDPTVATLLMSLEAVFAALSGWLLLHEALSAKELSGCVLVLIAVIAAQLPHPSEKMTKKKRGKMT